MSEVDGPRVCHTESEVRQKEKNIFHMYLPYANTYIQNLKKKKKGSEEPRGRTGIKTDADVKNGLEDRKNLNLL